MNEYVFLFADGSHQVILSETAPNVLVDRIVFGQPGSGSITVPREGLQLWYGPVTAQA